MYRKLLKWVVVLGIITSIIILGDDETRDYLKRKVKGIKL